MDLEFWDCIAKGKSSSYNERNTVGLSPSCMLFSLSWLNQIFSGFQGFVQNGILSLVCAFRIC